MKKEGKVKEAIRGGVAKVPVVIQMEALECGAACLAMVLAYYEKWIPLEQVRVDCGVSRDGSSAKNILLAARNYGLTADGYRCEPEVLRERGEFPYIIHWNFNHFVVLDGFRGNRAVINDPARGRVEVSMEDFDKSFTGICLKFVPGENFVPSGKRKSTLAFARKRLRGTGAAVAFVMLTSIIMYLFEIINPVMAQVFTDRLLTGQNPDWVWPFLGIMSTLAVLQIIVEWANTIYSLRINGKMAVMGSSSYMWKVLHLPMDFFSQRMAGDIQGRQATNSMIASSLVDTFAPLLLNMVMMVFYLVLMLRYSAILSLIGISTVFINLFFSRYISEKRVNLTRVSSRDSAKLESTKVAGIRMIETIKASGAENGFFQKWSGYQASVNSQMVNFERMNAILGMIPQFLAAVAGHAVMVMGIYLAMHGKFTVGMIITFQQFLASFLAPAGTIITAGQTIQEMRTSMERIEDVMEYPDDKALSGGGGEQVESYDKLLGNVELRNVTFGYSRLQPPLIQDFSMTLHSGSRVAFVGTSGCGKSTLSKLIAGLYQPWSGDILFDGKPLSAIDRDIFTGSLAVVDQDIILFEDTISSNIKMWDESIENFEVIMAARDAQIYDDIMQRDGGFSYQMIEGGKDFSGGQRQRLEIARVLAQDPSIIILDEATSALDAKTEYEVVEAIKNRGITCIIVAHRLSTIRDCDEIIVLDKGRVIERGTHEELYAKGGYYTTLVSNE